MNQQLPGASSALTMGILSVVLSLFCCGPFGAIFSIIGLSNAKSAENLYLQQPGEFSGYENVKTGRVLSYIGIAIAVIQVILGIIYFGVIIALITSGDFENFD
ncbi:CCC motif membrane protein [Maribacter halichondriae]|uniref:CCC motif membrane protein n=1 Tax=Maribacter halichondriae TaxID=2980554 RepID=UPI00235856FC|nr:CCC motif membrane protein [Maribacter sp. Hal144]